MQRPSAALQCLLLLLPWWPACAAGPLVAEADDAECLAWRGDSGCEGIRDEALCLGSRDGRPWRSWDGLPLAGQPCAWCGGENCTANGGALCMPHAWVKERAGISIANCSDHGTGAPRSTEGEFAAVAAAESAAAGAAQFELAADGTRCVANTSVDADLFNKFYWTFTAASTARCEGLCASRRYCTGYEYEASRGVCQLWWRTIDAVEEAPAGRLCARKRSSAPAGAAPAQERHDLRADDPESALAGAAAPLAGGSADETAGVGDGPVQMLDAAATALRREGPSRWAWLLMLGLLTLAMTASVCFFVRTPSEQRTRGYALPEECSDEEEGASGQLLQVDPQEHGAGRPATEGDGFRLLPPPVLLRRLHDASWLYKPLSSAEPMDFQGPASPAAPAPAAQRWPSPAAGAAAAGPHMGAASGHAAATTEGDGFRLLPPPVRPAAAWAGPASGPAAPPCVPAALATAAPAAAAEPVAAPPWAARASY